jgi:hypothetical protein
MHSHRLILHANSKAKGNKWNPMAMDLDVHADLLGLLLFGGQQTEMHRIWVYIYIYIGLQYTVDLERQKQNVFSTFWEFWGQGESDLWSQRESRGQSTKSG